MPTMLISNNTCDFNYNNVRLPESSLYIRLLHLHPPDSTSSGSSSSAPLRCFITVCAIDEPTPYHAISYTWGDPYSERAYLEVLRSDASESLGRLPITSSLDCALRHFRGLAAGSMMTLWIDQICINQADNSEKSEQVRIMHRIYSSAEQVRVWLGPAADDSDGAMEMWEEVGRSCEQEVNIASYFTSAENLEALWAHLQNRDPSNATTQKFQQLVNWAAPRIRPHLYPMAAILSRPWFRRVWVIQEFSLARKAALTCGLKTTAVQHPQWVLILYSLCKQLIQPEGYLTNTRDFEVDRLLLGQTYGAFFSIRKRKQDYDEQVQRGLVFTTREKSPPPGPGSGDCLFDLLRKVYAAEQREATDPRDRIYALLGLAVDRKKLERLGLTPDYQNCDLERVLMLTARAIMLRGDVQMLSFSQFPKDHVVPSWVPEWKPGMADPLYYISRRSTYTPIFKASGNSVSATIETNDIAIIALRGCRIDIVEDIANPWEQREWDVSNNSLYLTFFKQIQTLCHHSAVKGHDIYPSEARRTEAVWRVPVADRELSQNGVARATLENSGQMFPLYVESCELFENPESHPEPEARLEELRPGNIYGTYLESTCNRRPFITERGYVGMGPISTRAGDTVVAFAGAPMTYIIRPTVRGLHFQFLGEAYCDGVMDGEAWEESKVETFFLV